MEYKVIGQSFHSAERDQMKNEDSASSSVQRAFAIIRALAATQASGGRITHLAKATGLTQATTHRLLQSLVAEHIVEQDTSTRLYRLSIDFFALAAQAGNAMDLRALCRPSMLRLCASLGDTIFLLVRSGFDAVCLDRSEGPFPIRSFTGDIGGRVALGIGQGSLAILALLPEADRRAQRPGLMMANIYRALLRDIEAQGFQVLHQRTSVTPLRKLWIATRTHLRGR